MPFRRREEGPPRGRRPASPPPRRREPEEPAEPEGRPFRSSFRRDEPGYQTPWRREWEPGSGPRAEPFQERVERGVERGERRRELWEVLVPESERQEPYFDYGKVFEVLRSTRGAERPRPEVGPAPASARREGGPAPAPESRRAARSREGPPTVDPRNWFDTQAIWEAARRVRTDTRFQSGSPVALVQVAPASANEASRAADLIQFFRIPHQEVGRYPSTRLWIDLLHPFLDEMSFAFNTAKPQDLPGQFAFQSGRDGSFWLAYME